MLKTTLLFFMTALAEIIGCFLPYLWLKKGASGWLLLPAAISLMLFVWLLTLHPAASGRVYAAYGGVYVATALLWLRVVDGVKLSAMDWLGAGVALVGMLIIVAGWRTA
ncbi:MULTISPECIES: YnfA family protein [unclassified Serratia (in: enterobacteria)]|uniref:YnfA family protein n=1 Tax=unclassified Serratia (in: enterobacteria) TaxID=2647522 RepID=UPI0005017AFC|nr:MULTISPECIES: YnfA family protein [unclassified Serratia (in: enterobacteria)]KFK94670.1 membrane protein [Serratia sp. Ag2]KFK99170.1 membrane protein [Serratia sp. Ag1]